MITVLGKLLDTVKYLDLPGYNVLALQNQWTVAINRSWIKAAFDRGDDFLFVSREATGVYRQEFAFLYGLMIEKGKTMVIDLTPQANVIKNLEMALKGLAALKELRDENGRIYAIAYTQVELGLAILEKGAEAK